MKKESVQKVKKATGKKAAVKKATLKKATVALIMGSDSDWPVMKRAQTLLHDFGIEVMTRVVSAHRTPGDLAPFALEAEASGIQVIIAGAGGAAHLPGMMASFTRLPVIGVPIESKKLLGLDSLLSIAQMPEGIPVATMAIENAGNAAILAARILALHDRGLQTRLEKFAADLAKASRQKTKNLK